MSMGLKIQKMLREDGRDSYELEEEAKRRREVSDTVLELIYNKILSKGKNKGQTN